jgi:hypothetical protein
LTRWQTFHIEGYAVEAAIELRKTPHVSVDSPRWGAFAPARLTFIRVLSNREDVTLQLNPAECVDIERRVCEAAGIPFSGDAGVLPPPRPVPSFHDGGQGYIDWRHYA